RGRHVREHPLNSLVAGDRSAEGFAARRMRQRLVERRLSDAERLRRNRDTAAVERPHREAETLIDRSEDLIIGHADVQAEIDAAEPADAERVVAGAAADAGSVERHEKRRDPLSPQTRTRRREHDRYRRRFAVRDPDLAAGDPVTVAVPDRSRPLIG